MRCVSPTESLNCFVFTVQHPNPACLPPSHQSGALNHGNKKAKKEISTSVLLAHQGLGEILISFSLAGSRRYILPFGRCRRRHWRRVNESLATHRAQTTSEPRQELRFLGIKGCNHNMNLWQYKHQWFNHHASMGPRGFAIRVLLHFHDDTGAGGEHRLSYDVCRCRRAVVQLCSGQAKRVSAKLR